MTPAYRRQRHVQARSLHVSYSTDRTRTETREYLTEPGHETDACATLEQTLPGGWVVRWVFAEQGDSMVIRSVTVEPECQATPTGGVRANTLRELHPADVTSYLDSMITAATLAAEQPDSITPEALRLFVHRGLARMRVPYRERPAPPTGRPTLPDDFLAQVAQAHLDAKGKKVYANIAERVARQRGMRPAQVPSQTVKSWVDAAEARGYLGPAKQGSRRRQPGPRLLALWDRERENNN